MERVFRLGVLNIVSQPHSPSRYQDLLLKVRNRRKAARIRGDRFGIIGSMSKTDIPAKAGAFCQGYLTTFTQIDVEGDWVNVTTGQKAEDTERSQINIPANLRPNPTFNHFRFYPKEHLLIFEIGNGGFRLTPQNAEKLFERLFSADTIMKEFGEIVVTAVPSKDAISSILGDQKIRSIHLVIHAPNPDDGSKAEAQWMKRLEKMGAYSAEQRLVAKKDDNIKPDAQLIEAAKVAANNGMVEAVVKRGNRSQRISTKDSPFIHTHTYYTENNTLESEFGIACEIVRHQLRKKT